MGSSVRGSLALERAARAWALLDGRDYVVPEDVEQLFVPVIVAPRRVPPGFLARARATGWAEAIEDFRRPVPRARARARLRGGPAVRAAAARARGTHAAADDLPACPAAAARRALVRDDAQLRRGPRHRRRRLAAVPARRRHATRSTGPPRRGSRRATGSDEFIVRERFAEEAPRVVIVCDRRPEMAFFRPPLPWLDKAQAMRQTVELILASAALAGGFVGYLDFADGEPYWLPPQG